MKFDLPNNENDYMILESIKSAPAKVIHVFDLKGDPNQSVDEFRIGRSVETDMKIADISVSRVHSFIRVVKDELILDDNSSKFGTLVKIMKPKAILNVFGENGDEIKNTRHHQNASIYQIGRTMFYFKFYDGDSSLIR